MTTTLRTRARADDRAGDRLRVGMIIDDLRRGGAERFAVALAAGLDPERFDVTMVATRAGDWPAEEAFLAEHGVRYVNLGRRTRRDLAPWKPLVASLLRGEIDIVHSHLRGSNYWASVLGHACRVPVIIATEHSWAYEGQPVRRFLDRNVTGRLATVYVAVSEHDRRNLVDFVGVDRRRTDVVPTGLMPQAGIAPDIPPLRAQIGARPDEPIISTACQLRPEKALEVLIEAYGIVRAKIPSAHLVIAGDGPERDGLERLGERLGLADRIHFLGYRTDVADIFRQSTVMGMSSDREGSPLAVIEAMSAGCAVAATDVGGVSELAPHGQAALLVPRRKPLALGRAILSLLVDPALRARLTATGRARVAERYTLDAVVTNWRRVYETQIQAARRR